MDSCEDVCAAAVAFECPCGPNGAETTGAARIPDFEYMSMAAFDTVGVRSIRISCNRVLRRFKLN